MEKEEKIRRWRLILGKDSEKRLGTMDKKGTGLTEEQQLMDEALAAIYDRTESGGFGNGAGKGPSNPQITRWLGDVRQLFDKELVTIIQNDAMNRCGLKQLLFEPELLENLEPDLNLAAAIMTLKEQIPKHAKENVRVYIRKIIEDINRRLEQDVRHAVTAAVNKKQHSPVPSARAMDFKMTIGRNLKNYHQEIQAIVPEHFYFFERSASSPGKKWNIILDIDQSGSMSESVIYASVLSCILASMSSVTTRVVAFDTSVVDLTEKCGDPVDLLYGFQLGGGTDINASLAYCQKFIETPSRTLFFLISDLEEYGNPAGMLRKLREMKESGVTVCCLLAIQDGGGPRYSAATAGKVAAMEIPCFAASPEKLPEILEKAIKGQLK